MASLYKDIAKNTTANCGMWAKADTPAKMVTLTEAKSGSPPEKLSRRYPPVHGQRPQPCVGWI